MPLWLGGTDSLREVAAQIGLPCRTPRPFGICKIPRVPMVDTMDWRWAGSESCVCLVLFIEAIF